MQVVHPNCAGIDVHKRDLKVCAVHRDAAGQRIEQVRTFGTMTQQLEALRAWLRECGISVVAIESTGVYWKPVFNLLEADVQVMLVNPAHCKQVPGRKTDVKDCQWLAQLLEHGLLKGSFIPPQAIRDLRDLTRYRRRLIQQRAREVNRVQKVLETANIKLASVATDVMGKSGRAILAALLEGVQDTERLAKLARGRLRAKKGELEQALQGLFRPHHARLLTYILAHIDFLDEQIDECTRDIEALCRPFETELARLDTITGVDRRAAEELIAEVGVDMAVFASHQHLGSWAKMCPGNNESGGKRFSGRTGSGNCWLRSILVQCAHAAGHTKQTYLGVQYRRFAGRKGKRRAAVVVGHSILDAVYFILRDGVEYRELGAQHFDQLNKDRLIRYHVRRLESLGLKVNVQELAKSA